MPREHHPARGPQGWEEARGGWKPVAAGEPVELVAYPWDPGDETQTLVPCQDAILLRPVPRRRLTLRRAVDLLLMACAVVLLGYLILRSEEPGPSAHQLHEIADSISDPKRASQRPPNLLPVVEVARLAHRSPHAVDRVLGQPLRVAEITLPEAEVPGQWRDYRLLDGSVLTVKFAKDRAEVFTLHIGGESTDPLRGTASAEDALRLFGVDPESLTSRGSRTVPLASGSGRVRTWTGRLGGLTFEQVRVQSVGALTWTTAVVELAGR